MAKKVRAFFGVVVEYDPKYWNVEQLKVDSIREDFESNTDFSRLVEGSDVIDVKFEVDDVEIVEAEQ